MGDQVTLRKVLAGDFSIFFQNQQDPEARRMAAFAAKDPTDRVAVMAEWEKLLRNPRTSWKTVLLDGRVIGSILCFDLNGQPTVAYWYAKDCWGRGIATQSLRAFLRMVQQRPIFGRAAKDNLASIRVLEKCGFAVCGEERAFAKARGTEVEALILRRDTL
jgi:RimJ/RimL family protein N-acetyltransferase